MNLTYSNGNGTEITKDGITWKTQSKPVFSFEYSWLSYDDEQEKPGISDVEITDDRRVEIAAFLNAAAEPIPTRLLAVVIEDKVTALKNMRYSVEVGGINLGGMEIVTDEGSQAKITGAWVKVQIDPSTVIDWKAENGWIQINKAQVEAIASAVANHVQACFTNEKNHYNAIHALTTTSAVDAYDISTGWPT